MYIYIVIHRTMKLYYVSPVTKSQSCYQKSVLLLHVSPVTTRQSCYLTVYPFQKFANSIMFTFLPLVRSINISCPHL